MATVTGYTKSQVDSLLGEKAAALGEDDNYVTDAEKAVVSAFTANPAESAVNTVAASGATETLSAAYTLHKVTMDENCTFTFTSPTAGAVFAVNLVGAFTPTWPASVDWPDGAAPTYTSPSLYVFATFDGGTTWLGTSAGKAFA